MSMHELSLRLGPQPKHHLIKGQIAELEAAYHQMYNKLAAENSSMENEIGHVNKVNVVGMQRLA